LQPTYSIDDGVITASVGDKVIASGTELEDVEREVNEALAEPAKTASTSGATHVVSPNGLKGKILSRVAGVWGDTVTVRFDNGQIYQMPVTESTGFITENPKTASTNPLERFSSTLAKTVSPDAGSLQARNQELHSLITDARTTLIKGASVTDEARLNEFILQAQHEIREIKEAVDHINETEGQGFVPPAPFETRVIDQATVGYKDNPSWLDHTIDQADAEARETDFNALLDDGPTLLTAELDDATLADAGDTRERALAHVRAKTANITSDQIENYENLFVARAEEARRVELAHRKQNVKKEAAQKQSDVDNAPVESLFL